MARNDDYWERWNHYQKYGKWPAKASKVPVAPVLSAAVQWAKANPELAAYDNDGNPVEPSHWLDK